MTETTATTANCEKTPEELRRYELDAMFHAVPGVKKVYFQPPSTIKMKYPCIVYNRDGGRTFFAENRPYGFRRRYTGTVIDPNPDSSILDYIVTHFSLCYPDRHFTANNLNHDTFTIYY